MANLANCIVIPHEQKQGSSSILCPTGVFWTVMMTLYFWVKLMIFNCFFFSHKEVAVFNVRVSLFFLKLLSYSQQIAIIAISFKFLFKFYPTLCKYRNWLRDSEWNLSETHENWSLVVCCMALFMLHISTSNKTWVTFPDQYFSEGWCVFAPVCTSYLTLGRCLRDYGRFSECKCHKLSTQWMTVVGSDERGFLWLHFSINM